jgi:hypothetical protein
MRSRLERAEKAIEQERAASMKLRSQLEESQNQVSPSPHLFKNPCLVLRLLVLQFFATL